MLKFLALILLFILPSTSFAYLDPGTGSMILQGLIAGIAVGAVTIKHYWARFRAFFSRGAVEESADSPLHEEDENVR
jgi:hypothetical protein